MTWAGIIAHASIASAILARANQDLSRYEFDYWEDRRLSYLPHHHVDNEPEYQEMLKSEGMELKYNIFTDRKEIVKKGECPAANHYKRVNGVLDSIYHPEGTRDPYED